ncbi:MAG: PrsW family intramembrane metalloprotease [Kiritimatiellae bacterium]|nr:PrsW family intramembrane metalloprotease [Kiritimatiellia bacterium]
MNADIYDEPALAGTANPDDAASVELWNEEALADTNAAKADSERHSQRLRELWSNPPQSAGRRLAALVPAASGAFAVICTLAKGTIGLGLLAVAVGAPVIEEMAKVVLPLMLLEKRPWLYRGVSSIFTACIVSALVFASIENLLYITVYIPEKDLTGALIKYRLVVCTSLHVACTAISAYGLAAAWRRAKDRCSEFDMAAATPYLATAMAIHGVYNAIAALLTVG